MSVQGTILVLDGVSTNRIMLKVQLTAAWYHVVQGENVAGLATLLRRTRPDLVLTAQTLPGGTATDVKRLMQAGPALADVPIVAITPQNDKAAQLRALSDGLDDVLGYPPRDTLLLARVRSLLRRRADRQDINFKDDSQSIGFAESAAALIAPPPAARIAVLTQSPRTGALWRKALSGQTRHRLNTYTLPNLQGVLGATPPDAIVVELGTDGSDLKLLADLRSRGGTRHTVLIAVLTNDDSNLAAEALDRGVDAVCLGGFNTDEISLRLETQIARKTHDDRLRATLRKGLADSLIDPMTGLRNRRYAIRALDQIAHQSLSSRRGFAVMLADLDHFKAINDRFGHATGDQVLCEVARRLQAAMGVNGFVARIGGEEFMIGLPETTAKQALRKANLIRASICNSPVCLLDHPTQIPVTISIGLNLCAPPDLTRIDNTNPGNRLFQSADKALYAAKNAGRNQVHIRKSAA